MTSEWEPKSDEILSEHEYGMEHEDAGTGLWEQDAGNLELHADSCGTSEKFQEENREAIELQETDSMDTECSCCSEEDTIDHEFTGFHEEEQTEETRAERILEQVNDLIYSEETDGSLLTSVLGSRAGSNGDAFSFQTQEHLLGLTDTFSTQAHSKETVSPQPFKLISGPGSLLHQELQKGDLIIKRIPGYTRTYEGMLAEPSLIQASELALDSWNTIARESGFYGKVIEKFPYRHSLDYPKLRRIADNRNRVAKDTYIYRMIPEVRQHQEIIETGGTFRKIRPNEVQYLALEGGGGKGFAFVGAIQKLEQMGIVRLRNGKLDATRLKGISGASAGAISAVFLALGHNSSSITAIMNSVNFNTFFDLPQYRRKIPKIGGCISGNEGSFLQTILGTLTSVVRRIPLVGDRAAGLVASKFREYISAPRSAANVNSGPLPKLLAYWPLYIRNLIVDFGIFSGCTARDFFDRKIGEKFNGRRNITFRQLYAHTRIHLVLTTVNVESGNSEYLSHETTPNLPVADAVRMSMSLPYVYKPYRITATQASQIGNRRLAGLYVDGGTRNNIPIRAFQRFVRGGTPNTLGLRLEIDQQGTIDNVLKFFLHYSLMPGFLGTGESNVSITSGYSEQTISLDTTGLSTLEFNPPSATRRSVIRRSNRAVAQYFGI